MKTRKRITLILAVILMVTLILAACSSIGGNGDDGGTSIYVSAETEAAIVAACKASSALEQVTIGGELYTCDDYVWPASAIAACNTDSEAEVVVNGKIRSCDDMPEQASVAAEPTRVFAPTTTSPTNTQPASSAPAEYPYATWGPINAVWFYDQPVPYAVVEAIVGDSESVSDALADINAAMMLSGTSAIGGEWGTQQAREGFTLPGNTVFWSDLLNEGERPKCLEPLKVQGEWGIFYLPDDCSFKVPYVPGKGGGRWISVIDHELVNELWESRGRTPQTAVQAAIDAWNDSYSLNFEGGGTLTLDYGEFAIVWTDGPLPLEAFAIAREGNYGLFIVHTPGQWTINNGGAHVFRLP